MYIMFYEQAICEKETKTEKVLLEKDGRKNDYNYAGFTVLWNR